MRATLPGNVGRVLRVIFTSRPQIIHARSVQTRRSGNASNSNAKPTALGVSPVSKEQGLLASLRQFRRKKSDENWIRGPETIVFHVPKLHIFHRITAFFPAFVIFVTLTSIDTIWNHGLIENPSYNRFHPTADQPQYIPKPLEERLLFASLTAGSCVLVIGFIATLRRRVVRTIAFRTDQPRQPVTANNAAARLLRLGSGKRMVCLTTASGARFDYPIHDLKLGNSKRQDTLVIKAPDHWLLTFFFEVEDAELGWPEVTTILEPFTPMASSLQSDRKSMENQRAHHNRHAKQLFGLLWQTHAGADLVKGKVSDPWASR